MRRFFYLVVTLIFFSCNQSVLDINKIKGELRKLQYIDIDSMYLASNNLYINYTDNFPLFQPHFHSELAYLLFKDISDLDNMSNVEEIVFTCNLAKIDHDEFIYLFKSRNLITECKSKYLLNPLYNSMVEFLMNNDIAEDNRGALILLNDRYGYILNNRDDNMIYNENIFSLLYEYSKECNNNTLSIYSNNVNYINEELKLLSHPNAVKVGLVWDKLIEICESSIGN